MTDWRDHLRTLDVENVFVYVGDAVRLDYTPDSVLDHGVSFETAAASIHSPPSFASLATGCHPPTHGVFGFDNRVAPDVQTLFDLDEWNTRFYNSMREQPEDTDPIFSVLDVEPPESDDPIDSMEAPFAIMERGPGGHAPYGGFDGTAWEYFRARGNSPTERFRKEYAQAVASDVALFERRLSALAERDLLEDTLVVYTSDHGELLGEGGMLGHNGPMKPELIRIPTVLIHPSLPSKRVQGRLFRHVDLLPTLLSALKPDNECETDGVAASKSPDLPGLSFYRSRFSISAMLGLTGQLCYEGAWGQDGGHVFARSSVADRMTVFSGKLLRSASREYLRSHLSEAAGSYFQDRRSYGKPDWSPEYANEVLETVRNEYNGQERVALSDADREQLTDLGYLS